MRTDRGENPYATHYTAYFGDVPISVKNSSNTVDIRNRDDS
jgi:hypothetical protein